MKKFRRLALLLLAGVMALMVFSGCGDGTTPLEREAESVGIKMINAIRNEEAGKELPELHNSYEIRQKGLYMLGFIDPETGLIDYENAHMMVRTYKDGKEYTTVLFVITEDFGVGNKLLAMEMTPASLERLKAWYGIKTTAVVDGDDEYVDPIVNATAIGAAARTINGKTYMAWGFTVDTDSISGDMS